MKIFEIRLVLVTVLIGVLFGVFVHDTKVDKALTAYVAPIALGVAVAVDLSMLINRAHTHTEAGDFGMTHNAQLSRIRKDRRMFRRHMPGDRVLYVPGYS